MTVLDSVGVPMADAPVVIIPSLPPGVLQDGKAAAMPAAVVLPFTITGDCRGDLTILDVSGTPLRHLLVARELPAGRHNVVWNGLDDEGNAMNTGWYTAILVCHDAATGALVFEGERHLLQIHIDSDRTPFRTGGDGTVTITDRRIVPAFWTLPPVRHVDESGTLIQEFAVTTSTEILDLLSEFCATLRKIRMIHQWAVDQRAGERRADRRGECGPIALRRGWPP